MRISIYNLHNMCENNTLFLSRAWRYFLLNGHTVTDARNEADLAFIGGCAVTDLMRSRCEETILKSMATTMASTLRHLRVPGGLPGGVSIDRRARR